MAYRSSSAITPVNTGVVIGTLPAGATSTDLLIAVVSGVWINANKPITPPAGWTAIDVYSTGVAGGYQATFWAPGTVSSFTFATASGNAGWDLHIHAFSGRNLTTPISAHSMTNNGSDGVAPSVTAVAGDDLLVSWADAQNGTAGTPSGILTERTRTGSSEVLLCATANSVSTGATGTFTVSMAGFTDKSYSTLALAPATTTVTISNNPGATYAGMTSAGLSEELPTTVNRYPLIVSGSSYQAGGRYHSTIRLPGISNIPLGAIITSASMSMVTDGSAGAVQTLGLHNIKVTNDPLTTSWNIRSAGNSWTSNGGFNATDIDLTPVATTTSGASIVFSSAGLVSWIQSIVNGTTVNNGLMLARNPDTAYDAAYSNYASPANTPNGPVLTITYTSTAPASTSNNGATTIRIIASPRHTFGMRR